MKHLVKPECKNKCRFLQVTDELWLCPHAAYGAASYLAGAVAEARALLERNGGYEATLERVLAAEEARRDEAREKQQEKARRLAGSLKYD